MSIKFILQAMESKVGNPARKLVLIKLSDNANDQGFCFPSYQHIADHCEMSKRSVISHINQLVSDGFLIKSLRKTALGFSSNGYQIIVTGSENISLGGENISLGGENISPGGSENISPRTCHSFEPKEKINKKEIFEDDVLSVKQLCYFKPANVGDELWLAFIKIRKKRKATQSARAINGQLRELDLCEKAGISSTLAIERFLEESWKGLKYSWLCNLGLGNEENRRSGKASASERNAKLSQETSRQFREELAKGVADGLVR